MLIYGQTPDPRAMNDLQTLAAVIGFSANIPLIIGILRGTVKQSIATFILWAVLDTIAATTIFLQDGSWLLSAGYATSAILVATTLWIKKQRKWSADENWTTALVITCLICWYVIGPAAGTITSSLSVVIASWPQMKMTYKDPNTTPSGTYLWFEIANLIGLYAGKGWTVEERMYPMSVVFLTGVLLVLSLRKVKDLKSFVKKATTLI